MSANIIKNISSRQAAHDAYIASLTLEMAGLQGIVSYTKARKLFGKMFTDAASAGEIPHVMSGNARKYRISDIWHFVEDSITIGGDGIYLR